MENTHNCSDSCRQNFSIFGEYAKRIYAYIEIAHKESKRTWRMREKNLCAYTVEYGRKESMHKWRMHKTHVTNTTVYNRSIYKYNLIDVYKYNHIDVFINAFLESFGERKF